MQPPMSNSDRAIERACRLHEESIACRDRSEFPKAESNAREALCIFERQAGRNHPDVANILSNLAGIHTDRAAYEKAEPLYKRAVGIMEKFDGDADLDRLRIQCWNGLAILYRMQGRYAKAEPLFKRALMLAEKTRGAEDSDVATTLNNLAVLYKYTGHFNQAEKLYRRALRIVERACNRSLSHPREEGRSAGNASGKGEAEGADAVNYQNFLATLYHNLGGLEHSRGRFARGEPCARRSVEIRKKVLGPKHPAVAADLAALAGLLDGQGKYAESEALYHRAFKIFRRIYGPEHYEIAVTYNNLAAVYHARGKTVRAAKLYQRALAIKERLLGREHPDVAMTLNNLAMFYESLGQYSRAEPLLRRAIAIFKKALGPKNVKVLICKENLDSLQKSAKAAKRKRNHGLHG